MTMEPETTLLLDLDERNLSQFLAGLALAALARRVEGNGIESRCCWWPELGTLAIQTEFPSKEFGSLLFTCAYDFLKAMTWLPGLGGSASGLVVCGSEIGINPFIALSGEAGETTLLKAFSARVLPSATLPSQCERLLAPDDCADWLNQRDHGAGSWGFDCRVNRHASDAGYSSDAENTGNRDPFYPAVELLGLAATAFFVPAHAWQVARNALSAFACSQPLPLQMAALAATGRIHGLPGRSYQFADRGAAHGKGSAYRFFPPGALQPSIP
jgi:hypothetical protein